MEQVEAPVIKKRGRPKGSTKKVNLEAKLIKELDVNPNRKQRGRPKKIVSSSDGVEYSGTLLEQAEKRGYKVGSEIQALHDTMRGRIVSKPVECSYNGSVDTYLKVDVMTSFETVIPFFIFDPSTKNWSKIIKK